MLFVNAIGQVPEKFNYQGVLRNSTGELVKNTSITVKISLLQGSATSELKYSESHALITNDYGQFNVQVGVGIPIYGSFSVIDWSNEMYLKTEIANPAGGTLVDMGTVQLISVPYALYAENVEFNDDADADPTNELQNMTLVGDTLKISNGGQIVFPYDSSRWALNGDKMYYNTGNVGIGTNDPTSKLEVKSSGTTGALFQVINANNDTVFAVYPDGVKVFVDPDTKGKVGGFAVSGRTPAKAGGNVDYFRVTPDSTRIYVNDSIGNKGKVGGFAVSGRTPAKAGVIEYFSINKDSTRIYVNDSSSTKGKVGGFAVSGRTPAKQGESTKFMDMTKDNYFIGHEAGKMNISGLYNTFLGYQSGTLNISGKNNVYLGYKTGFSSNSGHDNVFLGYYSGFLNTSGSNNVFLGDSAGYNSNASNNIFIGTRAGVDNTTGTYNTFIGYEAGRYLNDAGYNVLIGYLSGGSASKSKQNVCVGNYTGQYLSAGAEYNTFIGNRSGVFTNSGKWNTFVGYASGYLNTTGNYNVFLGMNSGKTNTKGNSNVFIGQSSGELDTIGSYNVVIGTWAGYKTQGDKNVLLGYYSGYNETGSNKLYIDNSSTSAPLIWGDFFNDLLCFNANVGIGTTSPSYKLHVAGDIYANGGWVRVSGGAGIVFESFGGGWYMVDNAWIRTYGDKNIYHNTGFMRTDGTFQVGENGGTFNVGNGGNLAYRTNVLFANTSGKVGIGTASPDVALHVKGNSGLLNLEGSDHCFVQLYPDGFAAGRKGYFGYPDPDINDIYIKNEIASSNIFLIPGSGGYVRINGLPSGAGTALVADGSGNILKLSSDFRLKDNIKPLRHSLDKILKLQGVNFTWKNDSTNTIDIGFIAQEVEKIIPELVIKDNNDGYLSVKYPNITALLVEAVKELKTENDQLKKQLQELSNRLENLEK